MLKWKFFFDFSKRYFYLGKHFSPGGWFGRGFGLARCHSIKCDRTMWQAGSIASRSIMHHQSILYPHLVRAPLLFLQESQSTTLLNLVPQSVMPYVFSTSKFRCGVASFLSVARKFFCNISHATKLSSVTSYEGEDKKIILQHHLCCKNVSATRTMLGKILQQVLCCKKNLVAKYFCNKTFVAKTYLQHHLCCKSLYNTTYIRNVPATPLLLQERWHTWMSRSDGSRHQSNGHPGSGCFIVIHRLTRSIPL